MRCLRQLVKDSDSFTPDALRISFEDSVRGMNRAAQTAIADSRFSCRSERAIASKVTNNPGQGSPSRYLSTFISYR